MPLSRHEGALPYLLWRPPHAADGANLPLLVFLHGLEEGAPLEIHTALTRHGPLATGAWRGARKEFIVVAPQLPRRGDIWSRFSDSVRGIVEEIGAGHPTDRRRTFLTGFSFGGNGVFDVGLTQPDLWSALWAVDPTRVPGGCPEVPVWLSSGPLSRRYAADLASRLELEQLGWGPPGGRVYEDAGSDHVGTARISYGAPPVYEWLLSLPPRGM